MKGKIACASDALYFFSVLIAGIAVAELVSW